MEMSRMIYLDAKMFTYALEELVKGEASCANDQDRLQQKSKYIYPELMIKALGCELYLKSIITEETNESKPIQEHRLNELFDLLKNKTQNDIFQSFNISFNLDWSFDEFKSKLKNSAHVFVDSRYWYEKQKEYDYYFISNFFCCVMAYATVLFEKT